jgi:hypothetical protein
MEPPVAQHGHDRFVAVVAYNGRTFTEEIPPTQAAEAVYRKALKHFELEGSAANLGLFFNGSELNLQTSLASQGVPSGSTVVLQPRVVRNGGM